MRRKIIVGLFVMLFAASGLMGYRLFSSYAQEMVAVPALGETPGETPKIAEAADDAKDDSKSQAATEELQSPEAEELKLAPVKDASKSAISAQGGGRNRETGEVTPDNFQPRPEVFAHNYGDAESTGQATVGAKLPAKNLSQSEEGRDQQKWRQTGKMVASCTLGITLALLGLRYAVLRFWR